MEKPVPPLNVNKSKIIQRFLVCRIYLEIEKVGDTPPATALPTVAPGLHEELKRKLLYWKTGGPVVVRTADCCAAELQLAFTVTVA